MTRHLDTSAFIPLYVNEAASPALRRWFAALDRHEVTPSRWTLTEFTSALGVRVRTNTVAENAARRAVAAFRVLAWRSLTVVPTTPRGCDRAGDLLLRFDLGLRAGDALHVAIAQNAGATVFATLDKRLAAAAAALGLAVEQPA